MTQEEERLLLKDICGRLPYGVMVKIETDELYGDFNLDGYSYDYLRVQCLDFGIDDVKPYLRPIWSMTDYESNEWAEASNMKFDMEDGFFDAYDAHLSIDWLNAHHFDYRGLIPMGLALPAKEGMYDK